jgi:hypothetical protein
MGKIRWLNYSLIKISNQTGRLYTPLVLCTTAKTLATQPSAEAWASIRRVRHFKKDVPLPD